MSKKNIETLLQSRGHHGQLRSRDIAYNRVPTRSGNREKVGNFVIGREVGKNETPLKMLLCREKVSLLYRGRGLDLFAS